MKIAALAIILAVFVIASAKKGKKCRNESDCEADECCLKKRLFSSSYCTKLGKLGDECIDDEEMWIAHACPCAEGLICEGDEETETIFGKIKINQRCASGSSTPSPDVTSEAETVNPETEAQVEE